jgi:hypothetical protein
MAGKGKANARKSSNNKKRNVYERQRQRTTENKRRRLERHLVAHPEDNFAVEAKKKRLKGGGR